MSRKVWIVWMICLLGTCLVACGGDSSAENKTTKYVPDHENVAVRAGNTDVFMDEAKYYVFTAQATYETYYLTQNENIDWNSEMTKGSTWETVVKGQVLDEICKRECFYALAQQYNVSLTDVEEITLNKMVNAYFSDSNEVLKDKINIEKKRLKELFKKDMIARKVEEVLEAMSAEEGKETTANKKADEIYKEWKEQNEVTATKAWESIRLEGHIFTEEDLTNNQVLLDETGTE